MKTFDPRLIVSPPPIVIKDDMLRVKELIDFLAFNSLDIPKKCDKEPNK